MTQKKNNLDGNAGSRRKIDEINDVIATYERWT